MTLPGWLLVGIGGALGAMARYGVGLLLNPDRMPQTIPLGTMAVNVTGSLVLGVLFGLYFADPQRPHDHAWLLWGVGFCGAFTTMSTFSVETLTLLQRHHPGYGLLNIGLQGGLCLLAAYGGLLLGKR